MYHCNLLFYIFNMDEDRQRVIQNISPLEKFTHEFCMGRRFDVELAQKADVIIANLTNMDELLEFKQVAAFKKRDAQVILCGAKKQIENLFESEDMSEVTDVWDMPMTKKELVFRFKKWQNQFKQEKELWQTQSYLDATINSVPHLIWYKDKKGAHKKVNQSFCKLVGKTMEQIKDRGHYYIWDIEPEEYAKGEYICMESEYEVMNKRETCIFDEKVKAGEEMKQFKTYKTPLFDLDGSVMGTVGFADDITQEEIYRQMIIDNANRDFLTKLYNRRYLYQYMEELREQPFTIYYMDLDNFKCVNDKHGHHMGDRALVLARDVLVRTTKHAVIARVGGDEFIVIEEGVSTPKERSEKAKELQDSLEEKFGEDKCFEDISVSIGVAYSEKGKKEDIDSLIERADKLMYQMKKEKKCER